MLDRNIMFCLLIAMYILVVATKAIDDGEIIIGASGYVIALCQIYHTLKMGKFI